MFLMLSVSNKTYSVLLFNLITSFYQFILKIYKYFSRFMKFNVNKLISCFNALIYREAYLKKSQITVKISSI